MFLQLQVVYLFSVNKRLAIDFRCVLIFLNETAFIKNNKKIWMSIFRLWCLMSFGIINYKLI